MANSQYALRAVIGRCRRSNGDFRIAVIIEIINVVNWSIETSTRECDFMYHMNFLCTM